MLDRHPPGISTLSFAPINFHITPDNVIHHPHCAVFTESPFTTHYQPSSSSHLVYLCIDQDIQAVPFRPGDDDVIELLITALGSMDLVAGLFVCCSCAALYMT